MELGNALLSNSTSAVWGVVDCLAKSPSVALMQWPLPASTTGGLGGVVGVYAVPDSVFAQLSTTVVYILPIFVVAV